MDIQALFIPPASILAHYPVSCTVEVHRPAPINSHYLSDIQPKHIVSRHRLEALGLIDNKQITLVPLQRNVHLSAVKVLNMTPLFGPAGPQATDVNQGASGDCYLLAVLAAMAEKTPDEIESMIQRTDRSETDFWVKYTSPNDGQLQTMRVFDTAWVDEDKIPYYAGDRYQSKPKQRVSWVKLLENFFAKVNDRYEVVKPYAGFNGISLGGLPSTPYEIITGRTMDYIKPETQEEFDAIIQAANDNKVLVLGTKKETFSSVILPSRHAYAVLRTEEDEVILYNPWGSQLIINREILFENTQSLWLGH